MKEALLYEKLKECNVKCCLCNHRCIIPPDGRGLCGVRENQGGTLVSLVYGRVIAKNIDPIEKKPLFHFYPGSLSYSIATVGCNFRCLFCQNSDISQMPIDSGVIHGTPYTAQAIVSEALASGSKSISYTYTEPTVFFEFAYDTAALASEKGLKNVFVTNGYMTLEAIDHIRPYLNAANVDLKAFDDGFYKKTCKARLSPVLETLRHMKELGIHLEITTLLIPDLNDNIAMLKDMAIFIKDSLGTETPWHVSRFHPRYKLTDRGGTPVELIRKVRKIGVEAGLRYVYTGNIPGDEGENTLCHACGALLLKRFGFKVSHNIIENGNCPNCKTPVYGVWE
ncbi:MAG: AmmeMemoRadiSam system radical SAM enzyme [Pseudomonadota bacterium]